MGMNVQDGMNARLQQKPRSKPVAVYHGQKNISGQGVSSALERLGVAFEMISAPEIGRGRLADFAAVIFPGGHSVRLGEAALAQSLAFVRGGGGLLGVCAGAQFGAGLGLVKVRHRVLRAHGIFDMRLLVRHPVTRGYQVAGPHLAGEPWRYSNRGRLRVRYANGGYFESGRGVTVLVSLDERGRMGAVVAGRYGKGRVILCTPHPESTPSEDNPWADSGRSQEPLRLFANAVSYVADQCPLSRAGER